MPFVVDPSGGAEGNPQSDTEIAEELAALEEEVRRQEAELAAAEAEEAYVAEQDRKRRAAVEATASEAPEFGSGSFPGGASGLVKSGERGEGGRKKGGNGGKSGSGKREGKKGEEGKGEYESEEREAVEVRERLRFPYPAYSTVDFVKK